MYLTNEPQPFLPDYGGNWRGVIWRGKMTGEAGGLCNTYTLCCKRDKKCYQGPRVQHWTKYLMHLAISESVFPMWKPSLLAFPSHQVQVTEKHHLNTFAFKSLDWRAFVAGLADNTALMKSYRALACTRRYSYHTPGKRQSWDAWKESYDQPRQHIKKQRHYFANKGPSSQGYGFSSGHVWMWELDCEESWATKNGCFWTVVLEKTLESPQDCKEIHPVHPRGDQSWVFIGRTDAEAETPILWPSHAKSWLIGKDPDAGRDWGQEEKGTTEDEMAGWHHRLNGHEFE